jgi:hypothetical protein
MSDQVLFTAVMITTGTFENATVDEQYELSRRITHNFTKEDRSHLLVLIDKGHNDEARKYILERL